MSPLPDRRTVITAGAAGLLLPPAIAASTDDPIVTRITVEDGRLWVAATINGSRPLLFVVDTGAASNFIRPEIADELKLSAIESRVVGGLGKSRVMTGMVVARELTIGGSFRQPAAEFQLYQFANGLPKDAAGLLAAGLFTSRDSEIDFEKGEWRLWPRARPSFGGLAELNSTLDGDTRQRWSSRMIATAYVNGKPFRLLLDTGEPGNLLLFAQSASRSGLFADTVPYAPQRTAGFGGQAAKLSRLVRADSVQMGPLAVHSPLITIQDPDQATKWDHDGLLGLPFIQLLTVATSILRNKLYVARNHLPPPPDRYRLSGLWLDRTADGAASIGAVGVGSPAAYAGLKVGDRIADPATFAEAMRRLSQEPGKEIVFGVKRGDATVPIRYTVAPWL